MRLRWLPRAARDVDGIWDWIAADNIDAADHFVVRLAGAIDRLSDFPESGAPRPELGADARSIVVDRYVILYRIGADSVDIVRVLHGARDLGNLI
jgi:toxin ParE1/3/4